MYSNIFHDPVSSQFDRSSLIFFIEFGCNINYEWQIWSFLYQLFQSYADNNHTHPTGKNMICGFIGH